MSAAELTVVIPAFNEAGRIAETVDRVARELAAMAIAWELIVVNDGSTDETSAIARARAAVDPRVRVIDITHAGKGAAVRHGMLAARGAWCFLADADLSMPIDNLRRFYDPARGLPDVPIVIGSREAHGSRRFEEPLRRHLIGRAFNVTARLLVGLRIQDTQCGFKLFSGDAARALFAAQQLDGFSFDVEVLALARWAGFDVREVPIDWHYDRDSKVSWRAGAAAFADLVRIRWNLLRGVYGRPRVAEQHGV